MEILYSVLRHGSNSVFYHRTPSPSPSPTPPPTLTLQSKATSDFPHHHPQQTQLSSIIAHEHEYHQAELRFPTPPITPPRITHPPAADSYSVYGTKVGQGQIARQPQRRISNSNSTMSSSSHETELEIATSSESSSTPSSEHICHWTDCGSFFDSLTSLAAHVTQLHAIPLEDGLYYCRWSGCQRTERGFNARYKMLVHVRTHTKEKPHRCHLCEKSFSRAENLKIHIRSHSGEKPYLCSYPGCNKAYSNSSDRFKHTRTHAIEKPYVCKVPGCQKRYTDPSSLRKHVKTFKHGIQLIDSERLTAAAPIVVAAKQPTPTSVINPANISNTCSSTNNTLGVYHHSPVAAYDIYTYATPAVPQLFLPSDDVCRSMERTHLDYYYEAEHLKHAAYWSHAGCLPFGYSIPPLAIETPLDLPLDLRTNRK